MAEAKERTEFRRVFEAHRESVFRLLWRLTGNPHDAEDLTQETFVTHWRKRDRYRGDGSLEGYLRKIAFRRYLNSRSRLSARHPPVSLEEARLEADGRTEEVVEDADAKRYFLGRVREALDALPDRVREAFVLFRFEGLTVAAVADTTGAPVKTVESRLKRATELLSARLRKHRDQILPL
jgi:RNA polymerase sigma-70 factor (ECF subfamily)